MPKKLRNQSLFDSLREAQKPMAELQKLEEKREEIDAAAERRKKTILDRAERIDEYIAEWKENRLKAIDEKIAALQEAIDKGLDAFAKGKK